MFRSIRKVWFILEPHTKKRAYLLLGLMALASVAEAASIGMIFPLVQLLFDPQAAHANPIVGAGMEWMGVSDIREIVPLVILLTLLLYVAKNLFLMFVAYIQGRFIWNTLIGLWIRLYRIYLAREYSFHIQNNSAVLVTNITVALRNMFYSIVMPAINLFIEIMTIIAICAVLVAISPEITLLSLVALSATIALYYFLLRRKLGRWGAEQILHNKKMLLWLNQGLHGIKEVKVLGLENFFLDSFAESAVINGNHSRRNLIVVQMPRYIVEIVIICIVLGTIFVIQRFGNVEQTLPVMSVFALAAFRLMPAMSRISTYFSNIEFGVGALDSVYEDLLPLPEGGVAKDERDVGTEIAFKREIRLDNVAYRFPEAEHDALQGINLTIAKGEMVGFVGASGAGKTTLANLLLGLLEPTEGVITVDGQPIQGNLYAWRRHLGCVPQDVHLIDDSLRRNIALGVGLDEIDENMLVHAVSSSQLGETVSRMPAGLDTIVGEEGVRLSGGQRQRVAIARSLYHDSDVLFMDEATSSLDSETEHSIAQAIQGLFHDRTIIVIAHRLSTVKNCDRLYFMRDGRIEAVGTFNQLADTNERFRSMVEKMNVSTDSEAAA